MKNIYKEISDQIVQALENGVRPWHQPWNAAHMEGRVALPLRHNGVANCLLIEAVKDQSACQAAGYRRPRGFGLSVDRNPIR
jgi:antirestriction protein ArdC